RSSFMPSVFGMLLGLVPVRGAVFRVAVLPVVLNAAERERGIIRHEWVRVAELAEIGGPRADVEIAENGVVAALALQFGDRALRVLDVAEDNGLDRANLLAGGLDRAVGN